MKNRILPKAKPHTAKYAFLFRSAVARIALPLLAAFAAASVRAAEAPVWRGVFEAREMAVVPSEISMTVKAFLKQPGERCDEGETLVEFEDATVRAALRAAEAKRRSAETALNAMRNLHQRGQITALELARAESDFAQAELEVANAGRAVEACRVAAPFAGRIAENRVRAHEWAERGAPLFTLVDDRVLRARFFLPEERFSRIALGDRVEVAVPAASLRTSGEVSRLGVVFDPASKTFDVWADVANPDDAFRVGMTVEVAWPAGEAGE